MCRSRPICSPAGLRAPSLDGFSAAAPRWRFCGWRRYVPLPRTTPPLPLTETLVLTTIALAFYGFARWQDAGCGGNRWLWVTCAAVGYSILLRPEQGLLAVAVVPAMLWAALAAPRTPQGCASSAAPVLVAALCILLPLVPWTVRNWHTFGVFQPLAPRSANGSWRAPIPRLRPLVSRLGDRVLLHRRGLLGV